MSDPKPIETLRNMERDPALNTWWRKQSGRAADALEAKDKEIERLQEKCKYKDEVIDQRNAECSRQFNEIERLREALESIAKNTCCDNCQEAALIARAALADEPEQYTDTYTAETNKRLQRAVVDAAILWSESDAPSVERALLDAIVDYEAALWAEGGDE